MTKVDTKAAEAAADTGETPRPTGTNAKQDAEIAALTATNEALVAQMAAMQEQMAAITAALAANTATPATPAKPAGPALGVLTNDKAAELVLAARSDKPKTYRALQAGTDIMQGFVPEGAVFTSTQPQGSWMELVE